MFRFFRLAFGVMFRLFRRRGSLVLENLVLRQQVSVLKRKNRRPRLAGMDRWFWVAVRQVWPGWKASLLVVKPETVVEWHRRAFRRYWRLKSRAKQIGRTPISKELQQLIFQMASENPTWGAPRIHGELKMLGFDVAERTISRWMQRQPRKTDPAQRWLSFLRNHREAIVAMDLFTMPTVTFHLLYCFFIIAHDRRRVLHFNVTDHPTSTWITQQIRETFPDEAGARYLILDHDGKYGFEVPAAIRAMGIVPLHTALRSPWQNGVAERWIGSCRRELLDHVIPVSERHLRRLVSDYVDYYHDDRTHLGLDKQTPNGRTRAGSGGTVISFPRIGGLHHRYERAA
jgi:putative transposase